MAKVYFASKMEHAEKWRKLYTRCHISSRWPFLEPFVEPTPENARKFWQDDYTDIRNCGVLICYAEEGEKLRGALVEVGMALGMGKQVWLIGDHTDFGTWRYHPQISIYPDLETALAGLALV